ncbi:cell death abnormality protein 1-like isoform X2 [Saccostrea cucullata]|uniref:cell death abnormality protein 1-like isoform X2 n=1 Tax=Saccostrea cuccullata TaxID=36930 RepID=UPI002ED22AF3
MDGRKIFLVILFNVLATVESTCSSNDMKCCLPGLSWNYDLNTSCKIGFSGPNCENTCRYPSYGKRCQHECNCTQEFCDFVSGCQNSSACKIGFYGKKCENPCRYPSYGKRCQHECNCTQEFCDFVGGCRNSSDCNPGYYGLTCSDPCRFPNYGERCQSKCYCFETACHHIMGCQLGTEIPEILLVWNATSQEEGRSYMEKFQIIIIIGGSVIFTFVVIVVMVVITMVRRVIRSDKRKKFECNFDSEFSSCHSSPGDTVRGTCTTSARCVQSFDLNGKSVESYEFEIYENTSMSIQGNRDER